MKRIIRQTEPKVKTISIHGLDPEAEKLLQKKAQTQNLSLNKAIKSILNEALGLTPKKTNRRTEFADLSGIWTREDEREFAAAIRDFETIDPGDWP
jgi:hypothetical protein